jgi:nucleoid DNA-binding protein
MKKPDIAKRMARESGLSEAEAADRLDRVVHQIISNLRRGRSAPLPGMGKFTARPDGGIEFEADKGDRRD